MSGQVDFIRKTRDAAIAVLEGHELVVVPTAPDDVEPGDLEAATRLLRVLPKPEEGDER